MEMIKCLVAIFLVSSLSRQVSGQVTTACTSSLLLSFTPCFNYLTGSTNGGGSPTTECCKSLASIISSGTECACLIVTGNVPFSLPINRTLTISLPKLCKSQSVPLQCQATAMPLPGPGPVSYGPGLPPLPPRVPDTTTPSLAPTLDLPASPPAADNSPLNQGMRPLINLPSSAVKLPEMNSSSLLMFFALGAVLLKKF